jgi:site-specific DNA-adenine methylase
MTQYKFYREPGKVLYADPEYWQWVATYTDGSELYQFDAQTEMYHQFKEIEQDRLASFTMYNNQDDPPEITIPWKKGRKLIHFYSNTMTFSSNGSRSSSKEYCFGYEEDGHKVILHILPDDSIVVKNE